MSKNKGPRNTHPSQKKHTNHNNIQQNEAQPQQVKWCSAHNKKSSECGCK
jgi:hypothetical protein